MKIVHVTECLAGGVLTFLAKLTQALSEEEHILIYSDRPSTPKNVEKYFGDNVKLVYWQNATREISPVKDTKALLELMNLMKDYEDADVVQLHSSKAGVLGRIACRFLGFKKVFYIPHGVSFAREDVSVKKKAFYVLLEKIGNCFSGEYIACSESVKDLLEENGIRNVHVINNGVEPNPTKPVYRDFQYPLVIGTVGRLTYQKNPALFDKIAASFEQDSRVKFVWIGDGELRSDVNDRQNTTVTGWLKPEEVQKQLHQIDVYISTALWEGLPYSVLEAMNAGKPLLLTNCVGNRDLVNSKNGATFSNCDEAHQAIETILQHPEEIPSKGLASYEQIVTTFSIENMKRQYLLLYRN